MAKNFTRRVSYDGQSVFATFIPEMRKDGLYYEVNVPHLPRFHMSWSPLGRYDVLPGQDADVPYALILAISDILEKL
jgi:hypothetical protein